MGILSRLRKPEVVPIETESPAVIMRRQEVEELRAAAMVPEMNDNGEDPMSSATFARIIERPHGFGYEVCVGGVTVIVQDFHPDKEGNSPMTEDEAKAAADRALNAYGRA